MARAKRHYLPGHVWHITHRCHQREFLFKFSKDRKRYLEWLFEAKKRYGLVILNYMATSNHIHLLVLDDKEREVIPKSMQLAAGRTGQEFNQRKRRKGAFWEDRYHATAIQKDLHFIRCLMYIDLNMVRAGVVKHPSEWHFSGYNEIQQPHARYSLIDHQSLLNILNMDNRKELAEKHATWIHGALNNIHQQRDSKWTKSIAAGDKTFVDSVKKQLGYLAIGRKTFKTRDGYHLREEQSLYGIEDEAVENTFLWDFESEPALSAIS